MHFNKNEPLYAMEKMMRSVPDFVPRKHGSVVTSDSEQLQPKSYDEMIRMATSGIQNELFLERVDQLIQESETKKMTYQSKKHKEVFDKAMIKKNENNYKLIAVIYLLTADNTLWNLAKDAVKKNVVDFEAIKLNAIHPTGYTLFCAAKDLYLGTRHLTISDLTDRNLVSPKMFGVISNAMAIRRFGMRAFAVSEHMWQ